MYEGCPLELYLMIANRDVCFLLGWRPMTRDERQSELVRLLKTNLPKLLEMYRRTLGTVPPTAILGSQLVQAILDAEFPAKP